MSTDTAELKAELIQASALLLSETDPLSQISRVGSLLRISTSLLDMLTIEAVQAIRERDRPAADFLKFVDNVTSDHAPDCPDPAACPAKPRPPAHLREVPREIKRKWLNGDRHTCVKGVDFAQSPKAFGLMINHLARSVDMAASYRILGDQVTFYCVPKEVTP